MKSVKPEKIPISDILRLSGADGPGGGSCPDENTLAALLAGTLHQEERQALEQHFLSCPQCRDLVAGELRSRPGFRILRILSMAAGAAALIGVVAYIFTRDKPVQEVPELLAQGKVSRAAQRFVEQQPTLGQFRDPKTNLQNERTVYRSAEDDSLALLEPSGKILCPQGPPVFRWRYKDESVKGVPMHLVLEWLPAVGVRIKVDSGATSYFGDPERFPELPRGARPEDHPIQWYLEYRKGGRNRNSQVLTFFLASPKMLDRIKGGFLRLETELQSFADVEGLHDLRALLKANLLERNGLFLDALSELHGISRKDHTIQKRIADLATHCGLRE